VLVCTVGRLSSAEATHDLHGFIDDFALNVFGNLVPIKVVLRRMVAAKHGRIVVISSTSGHHAPANLTAYAPAKWALENLCGALRSELQGTGVSIDVVRPRNLRNKYSGVFQTDVALAPERVARRVADLAARAQDDGGGTAQFVPRRYRFVRVLERLLPGLLDRGMGLRSSRRRSAAYRNGAIASAMITGASSGLGRELAVLYGQTLERLHLVARTGSALLELKQQIEATSPCRVRIDAVDLADPNQTAAYIERAQPVDMLINNAGFHVHAHVVDTPLEVIRQNLEANFLASVRMTANLLARESRPRKVINVISTTAIAGRRNLGSYSASKAALWAFTRSLRRVYGNSMQILEVLPSTFESSLFHKGFAVQHREASGSPPTGRILTSRQVARAIMRAEATGKERLLVPLEARAFLLLETVCPPLFRRVFP
jgi:short-subunit dehydrogenase